MTRREELQDRYEDALFALLMNEMAEIEGAMAWEENERLKNDPSAAIPEDVDKRCLQSIRRSFAKQKARAAGRFTAKAIKRVVMVVGVVAILFTTAFATSETLRANTLNLVIEVFDTNTEFRFVEKSVNTISQFRVGWVPGGYSLTGQGSNDIEIWYEFQTLENEYLCINCRRTDGIVIGVDTENAEVEPIEINGAQAMLVRKENELQLTWATDDNTIFTSIIGTGISQEDIIHIANEICY